MSPGLFDGTPLERPITCERCSRPLPDCSCPRSADGRVCTPADQPARVRREQRRGKFVTVVTGLDPSATDLTALASQLRRKFGVGGAVTGAGPAAAKRNEQPAIELQGDLREPVVALLREMGYPAKPAGG